MCPRSAPRAERVLKLTSQADLASGAIPALSAMRHERKSRRPGWSVFSGVSPGPPESLPLLV